MTNRTIICLVTLALGGPACIGIPGNGERATETRDLSGFTRIDNRDALDVQVEQGPAFAVTVSIDSNLLAHVETHVAGDALVIGVDQNVADVVRGPHVLVTMPRVDALTVNGSGDLRMPALNQDSPLALSVSGSGDMQWQGSVPEIHADQNASGDLRLAGSSDRLAVAVRGSGDLAAASLEAASGTIELDGSGDASVTIRQSAEVSLRGSGDLDLFGGATLSRVIRTGSGDLRLHR